MSRLSTPDKLIESVRGFTAVDPLPPLSGLVEKKNVYDTVCLLARLNANKRAPYDDDGTVVVWRTARVEGREKKSGADRGRGKRERGQTGEGETGGTVKAVCFVSNCAAMIDDAVSGILLETLSVGSIDNSPGG